MNYIRHLWTAHTSGWRAYKKQARKRFTELRRPKPQPAASSAQPEGV